MKTTVLGLVACAALVVALRPAPAQPELPKGEALPDFPMIDAKNNKQQPLHPDKKSIIAEVATVDGKNRVVRVGIVTEVCLREGPLEQFLCKKGTKEHEAVLRVDMDAELVHLAIIAAGGRSGTPTGFIDKNEQPKHTPATGSRVNVSVHYKKDGKLHTHAAQEWIWDTKKKAPIAHQWVFAGSVYIKNPDNPNAKPYYGANSGDIFSISNFPYSTLEFPVPISKDEAQLTYEAKTDKIPPLTSKVWMLIEVPAK